MNHDEIVIKTETVKVGDLTEREKQIWDHGYLCGFENADGYKHKNKANVISMIIVVFFAAMFISFVAAMS